MADDRFAYQNDDAVGLEARKIWCHESTLEAAEKIDAGHIARRGFSVSDTVNNNSTLDIIIGDKTKDGRITVQILASRNGVYLSWDLDIMNDNSAITIANLTSRRIGGANFGLTFTNLYYDLNDIKLTLSATDATYNIGITYKLSIINFTGTQNDFEIY